MKKLVIALTLALALFGATVYGGSGISLNIDGSDVQFDVMPQIVEGRTMVPVRAIFEAVGAEIEWDSNTKTVTGVKDDTTVIMTVNSSIETINGESVEMDAAPLIIDGRTLAPARYVAEAFGCSVDWDGESKTVYINTPSETVTEITTETTTETITEETTETAEDETLADWIEFLMRGDDKTGVISEDDFENEELAQMHETVRGHFEEFYLPANFYTVEEEYMKQFMCYTDGESVNEMLATLWANNVTNQSSLFVEHYLYMLGEDYSDLSDDEWFELFIEVIKKAYLYESAIECTSMCTVDDDTRVLLLFMTDDYYLSYCSYIAIVYNLDMGISYYALEKSSKDDFTVYYFDEDCVKNAVAEFKSSDDDRLNFLLALQEEFENKGWI